MRKSESSRPILALPALLLAIGFVGFAPVGALAQTRYRVRQSENFRQQPEPRAARLGLIQAGTVVSGVGSRGQWLQVQVTGWIWSRSIGRIGSPEYDLRVTAQPGENLRDGPNGNIIGRLGTGALLDELDRQGNWVNVTRVGWMWGESLELVSGSGTPPVRAGTPQPVADTSAVTLDAAVLDARTAIRSIPDGTNRAVASTATPVRILARSGPWVRVQLEGWVREEDLRQATDEVQIGVTGAEVRANPDYYNGKLIQWRLQYISVQVADELRRDLPVGQRYVLARGPVPEPGFVYALINEDQFARVAPLPPLSELLVIGRVRAGRSEQLGNPIIDVVDLAPSDRRERNGNE